MSASHKETLLQKDSPREAAVAVAGAVAAEDADDDSNVPPAAKRPKKSPADDLICPITLELPWDPHTAEDGRVYEKDAIEQHINMHRLTGDLRSPVTGVIMGPRIFPSPQHRNLIETLIENDSIPEEALVTAWNQRVKDAMKMQELLRTAKNGDAESMLKVAQCYQYGKLNNRKDYKLAFAWHRKSHAAGNIRATALVGISYIMGWGIPKYVKKGIMFLTEAAALGSDFACYQLGMFLADGSHGVPVDKEEAIRWLRKSLGDCPHKHLSEHGRELSQAKLNELENYRSLLDV